MAYILEEDRGSREGSHRRSIHSVPHPPTPPWEAGCTSDVKVVLLNDHCVPEVGFAPKRNLAAVSRTRDVYTCSYTCQDQEEGKCASF